MALAARDSAYYPHQSSGLLVFDPLLGKPRYKPWWAVLKVDKGAIDFYAWLLKKQGVLVEKGAPSGSHISFIKGWEPPIKEPWGLDFGEITFWYSNIIRTDNGKHAWLDVWSDQMSEIRMLFGWDAKPYYHMTLGRL